MVLIYNFNFITNFIPIILKEVCGKMWAFLRFSIFPVKTTRRLYLLDNSLI